MVPLIGFGFMPAFVALLLYSMLPIVRNTVTGLMNVDARMIEAARGLGMTPGQQLLRVELPLALPLIIAGVRTATIWVIGIATLSTPVGQPSLGNFIFSGLQTRNWTAVLFGCIGAAALAIVLDLLIAMLESGVAKAGQPLANLDCDLRCFTAIFLDGPRAESCRTQISRAQHAQPSPPSSSAARRSPSSTFSPNSSPRCCARTN